MRKEGKQNGGWPMTDVFVPAAVIITGHAHHTNAPYAPMYVPAKIAAAVGATPTAALPRSAYVAIPMRVTMSKAFATLKLLGFLQSPRSDCSEAVRGSRTVRGFRANISRSQTKTYRDEGDQAGAKRGRQSLDSQPFWTTHETLAPFECST